MLMIQQHSVTQKQTSFNIATVNESMIFEIIFLALSHKKRQNHVTFEKN